MPRNKPRRHPPHRRSVSRRSARCLPGDSSVLAAHPSRTRRAMDLRRKSADLKRTAKPDKHRKGRYRRCRLFRRPNAGGPTLGGDVRLCGAAPKDPAAKIATAFRQFRKIAFAFWRQVIPLETGLSDIGHAMCDDHQGQCRASGGQATLIALQAAPPTCSVCSSGLARSKDTTPVRERSG